MENQLRVNDEPARYEPLTPAEIHQLPAADAQRYNFVRETVQGNQRLVMFLKDHAPQTHAITKVQVPENRYLVLGDNRDNSQDSRVIGFVDRDLILGKAESVAFSLDYDRYYQPRMDRFFTALP